MLVCVTVMMAIAVMLILVNDLPLVSSSYLIEVLSSRGVQVNLGLTAKAAGRQLEKRYFSRFSFLLPPISLLKTRIMSASRPT